MEYAKMGCAAALKQVKLSPDMSESELARQLGVFWDGVFGDVSAALGGNEAEKTIYRVLISQQKAMPRFSQWQRRVAVAPPPVPVAQAKPNFLLIPLAAAAAIMLVAMVLALVSLKIGLALVCLLAVLPIGLAALLMLRKEQEILPPPPMVEAAAHSWDVPAIQASLAKAAERIDADAMALVPRGNAKAQPEAISLAAELLGLVYQGSVPNGDFVLGQVESYLLRHGIEKVDYSPERAGLFTLLPANGEKTLAPALLKDGQLLSKGTACIKM